nr:unnamed protein product [Digitaria exilis]
MSMSSSSTVPHVVEERKLPTANLAMEDLLLTGGRRGSGQGHGSLRQVGTAGTSACMAGSGTGDATRCGVAGDPSVGCSGQRWSIRPGSIDHVIAIIHRPSLEPCAGCFLT